MSMYRKADCFYTFAGWLRVNIIRAQMTQKEIADVMSVTPSWVSQCSTGYYRPVRYVTVEKFSIALGHPEDARNVWRLLCN